MANVRLNVFRGDAGGGEIKAYDVETDPGMVVLDVVHRLQATQTPDARPWRDWRNFATTSRDGVA